MNANNFKIKKVLIFLLKFFVVCGAYYFVLKKILNSPDIENFKLYFTDLNCNRIYILIILIVFMFVNWGLEAYKWKNILIPLEKIEFLKAFKAVWTGITVGTVTPNRVGEFGGRILFLKKGNRVKAVPLTLYSDLSQFIATIIFGIIGFYFISHNVVFENSEIKALETLIWVIGISVIIISLFFYFNINYCIEKLKKLKKIKKAVFKFSPETEISNNDKIITLFLSILRYIIFNSQFYFALLFFDIDITFINSLIATSSIYLCLNIIPNIPFAEIGLRASFAVIFLGFYSDKITAIVLASLLIYVINIAIPTIGGGIMMLILNTTKKDIEEK